MPPRKKANTDAATLDSPEDVMAAINKQFGEGAIGFASDPELQVTRWSTGVYPLDDLFDGGLPRGRFVELYGPYSTMKSYMLYKALGSVQKQGGKAALIDTEHSFDPEWATDLGVDIDSLFISRPETAEQGIGVMEALIRQKYDLVGFDSIAAAQPKQYREAMPGDDNAPGGLARVMSRGLARLNAANKKTSAIFINQTRNKIGVSFGSPITTSGGMAMGFYASYRCSFARIEKVTEPYKQWDGEKYIDGKRVIAHKIKATLEKSKLSAPHGDVIFTYDLRTGEVDESGYVIGKALEKGLVTRTAQGHWNVPEVMEKAIHGRDKFFTFLEETPEVIDYLKAEL